MYLNNTTFRDVMLCNLLQIYQFLEIGTVFSKLCAESHLQVVQVNQLFRDKVCFHHQGSLCFRIQGRICYPEEADHTVSHSKY